MADWLTLGAAISAYVHDGDALCWKGLPTSVHLPPDMRLFAKAARPVSGSNDSGQCGRMLP